MTSPLMGILGVLAILAIAVLFSSNRRGIRLRNRVRLDRENPRPAAEHLLHDRLLARVVQPTDVQDDRFAAPKLGRAHWRARRYGRLKRFRARRGPC